MQALGKESIMIWRMLSYFYTGMVVLHPGKVGYYY